jgi:hypothetical protein
MRALSLFILTMTMLALSACSINDLWFPTLVIGSGNMVTKEFSLTDFQSVAVGNAFQTEITQAENFSVSITADDNLFDYIQVEKFGQQLKIRFDHTHGFGHGTLKAKITMPTLEALHVSGASQVYLSGFKLSKPIDIEVSGASTLDGSLVADRVNMLASGASRINLKGTATELNLKADGASRTNLDDLIVDTASVHFSGASNGSIAAKNKLDYDLSGASNLTYLGRPTISTSRTSGASSIHQR